MRINTSAIECEKDVSWAHIRIALLVIGILGISIALAARFLLPYIAHERNSILGPRLDIKGLEIAIKSYKTEYLRLPSISAETFVKDSDAIDTTSTLGVELLNILLDRNSSKNPRHIPFWDAPPIKSYGSRFSSGTGLVDGWSHRGYKIVLDYNGDGLIDDPSGSKTPISSDVILYSAGSDGDFSTWNDNICSWK